MIIQNGKGDNTEGERESYKMGKGVIQKGKGDHTKWERG